MDMTITERILARHCGKDQVKPGEFINARVDVALANDITGPIAIKEFERMGATRVFDPERIALVPDHFVPNKDIASAGQVKALRDFARKHRIPHFFEVGRMGVEHALLPELGLVLPGDLVVGADSHTCTYGAVGAFSTGVGSTDLACAMALGEVWLRVPETIKVLYHGKTGPWVSGKDLILHTIGRIGVDGARYKAMEFSGEALAALSMDDRFTITNMAVEAGAKNGILEPDDKCLQYAREVSGQRRTYTAYCSDPGARYSHVYEFDASSLEPQVALPHSPANARSVRDLDEIPIDQVVIGSCTNGRYEDMRVAREILRGRQVHPAVRLIVIPATQAVYLRCIKEGIMEDLVSAGAAVSTPTCGPCLGGHMGILAEGERALATTNRNFLGRMGHRTSEIYLSGPAVAAASAVAGHIVHPEEVF
jgi:3-isopropylmalate/(R)-2-methylmalate dehydratase large subunit